jgi:flagellar hook-length control protein FliK
MSQTRSILAISAPAADDAPSSTREDQPNEFAALLASSFCASTPANNPPVETTPGNTSSDASSPQEVEPTQDRFTAAPLSIQALPTANANPISVADANSKMLMPVRILDHSLAVNPAPQAQGMDGAAPDSGIIKPNLQLPSFAEISDEASRGLQPNRATLNSISTAGSNSEISESKENFPAPGEWKNGFSNGSGIAEPTAQMSLSSEIALDNLAPGRGAPALNAPVAVKAILPVEDIPATNNTPSVENPSMFSMEVDKGAADSQLSVGNLASAIDELFQRYNEQLRPQSLIFKAQPQTEGLAEKAIKIAPDAAQIPGALQPPAFDIQNPDSDSSRFAQTNYAPMLADSSEETGAAFNRISSVMHSLRTNAPSEKSLTELAQDGLKLKEMEDTSGGQGQTLFATPEVQSTSANDAQSVARTVADQMVRHISEAADGINRRETRALRINLRPEELGQVEIEVKRDGEGRLSAQLTVENDSAHHALSGGLNQLRAALDRAGLNFDSLNISYGAQLSSHQGGQSSGGRRDQADGLLPSNALGVENSGASADTESSESVLSKLISLRA